MSTTITSPGNAALAAATLAVVALMLSGCASGFVSGGVATASARDGRIDIDSRSGTAAVGPAGPSVETQHRRGSVCVDRTSGAVAGC